jgi:ribosome-binding factor A
MQDKRSIRSNKVASEIQRILSEYLLSNPIIDHDGIKPSLISITAVRVSACLQHAKIYITSLSNDVMNEECLAFLERHISRLRNRLASLLRLKFTPELKFFIDDSYDHAAKIKSLLSKISESN